MRMNDQEVESLQILFKKTTERALSNYMRKVILHKPVTIRYRNQSADDFLQEMIVMKRELSAIGNNFNQAVKKLHILEKIPEFRIWITQHDSLYLEFLTKMEQIKIRMNEHYEKWSQG